MRRTENHCCNCAVGAYPCIGDRCPRRRVEVIYCDICGYPINVEHGYHDIHGKDVCEDCFEKGEEQNEG